MELEFESKSSWAELEFDLISGWVELEWDLGWLEFDPWARILASVGSVGLRSIWSSTRTSVELNWSLTQTQIDHPLSWLPHLGDSAIVELGTEVLLLSICGCRQSEILLWLVIVITIIVPDHDLFCTVLIGFSSSSITSSTWGSCFWTFWGYKLVVTPLCFSFFVI